MQKKVIAAMVALMMVATGIVILEMTQESDASATDGLATYNFFFAKQGDTSWTTHQGSGYNAFIALKATLDDKFITYGVDSILTPLSGLGSQYECSELCYQFVHSVYP